MNESMETIVDARPLEASLELLKCGVSMSPNSVAAWLEKGFGRHSVIVASGRVDSGVAMICRDHDRIDMRRTYHRNGEGVAMRQMLFHAITQIARDTAVPRVTVTVEVTAPNHSELTQWEKLGFVRRGRKPFSSFGKLYFELEILVGVSDE